MHFQDFDFARGGGVGGSWGGGEGNRTVSKLAAPKILHGERLPQLHLWSQEAPEVRDAPISNIC
jgi:hypothetical protein